MSQDIITKVVGVLGESSQPLSIDAIRHRSNIRSGDEARAILWNIFPRRRLGEILKQLAEGSTISDYLRHLRMNLT